MRKVFAAIASVVIGIALFVAVVGSAGLRNILGSFKDFSVIYLALFLFVSFLIACTVTYRWWVILKSEGFHVPFIKLALYRTMGYAVSYVTPSAHLGGEPVMAYMLHKKHDIPTSRAFSSVLIAKSLEIAADILFGCIGVFLILLRFALPKQMILFVISGLALAIIMLGLFFTRLIKGQGFFSTVMKIVPYPLRSTYFKLLIRRVRETELCITSFLRNRAECVLFAVSISAVLWALMGLEYMLALRLVGFDPTLRTIFMAGGFVAISYLVPVPAAIGVLEAGQYSIFKVIGASPHTGVALGLLIRARDLLWTLLGFILISHYGIKSIRGILENGKQES